jgi:hypothetical protein
MDPYHVAGSAWIRIILPDPHGCVSCCRIRMDPYHFAGSAWILIILPDLHNPYHLAKSAAKTYASGSGYLVGFSTLI